MRSKKHEKEAREQQGKGTEGKKRKKHEKKAQE
jgi:hypothetical protein